QGASLYIPSHNSLLVGSDLLEVLQRYLITHVTLPPSVLRSIESSRAPECLSTIVVAGEPCPQNLAETWAPHRCFINAYGPTETTVCATTHTCKAGTGEPPPIGRPIRNTRIYILDAERRAGPTGTVGEVHSRVGGGGMR